MNGLILLDDEQQRSLDAFAQHAPPLPPSQFHVEPSPQFRTDFTTPVTPVPTDYTRDVGLPRTDFTTHRTSGFSNGGGGKHSSFTRRSSLTAPMTVDYAPLRSGLGTPFEQPMSDSYPMLRDDPHRPSSTNSSNNPNHHTVHQYAGTSSGLNISVSWIMVGLSFGLLSGLLLSEARVSPTAAQWISLPGDLFLRALKCLVVPYVFCSVAVAVGDIVFVGKVSVIGWQTAKIFLLFWTATAAMGVTVALLFRPFFRPHGEDPKKVANTMGFMCTNRQLLTTTANGTIACSTNTTLLDTTTTFVVVDKTDYFLKHGAAVATLSLSDQLMQMILPVVSKNVVASLASGDVLSIITFSMLLGTVAGHNYFTRSRHTNYVYLSLLQLRNTFFLLMEWTIWLSPVAVVSVVAGSFASNRDFIGTFGDIYPYLIAAIAGCLLQVLVVYPLIVFLMTRTNPFSHMKHMVRAYVFAFACASSLATMPVTLSCVKRAKMCSQSVANFVVSIGVASNISGMGFYLPIAIVFIAESSGNGALLTPLRVFGLFVLSVLACAGTPPIPASGLVVISTAYTTLFGEMSHTAFAYVAAMDFFFDRITTTCNVNDDVMALKIISETTDETVAQDQLGQRF